MVRTRERNSIDWRRIRDGYRQNTVSIRSLARDFQVSDAAIRKRARKENWVRVAPPVGSREPGQGSSFGSRLDALAAALAATSGGCADSARASDRRFVAAMVALAAPASAIALALDVPEQKLFAEFAVEMASAATMEGARDIRAGLRARTP